MSGPPRTRTTVRDNLDSIELASKFHGSNSFFLSFFASPVCFGLSPTDFLLLVQKKVGKEKYTPGRRLILRAVGSVRVVRTALPCAGLTQISSMKFAPTPPPVLGTPLRGIRCPWRGLSKQKTDGALKGRVFDRS